MGPQTESSAPACAAGISLSVTKIQTYTAHINYILNCCPAGIAQPQIKFTNTTVVLVDTLASIPLLRHAKKAYLLIQVMPFFLFDGWLVALLTRPDT